MLPRVAVVCSDASAVVSSGPRSTTDAGSPSYLFGLCRRGSPSGGAPPRGRPAASRCRASCALPAASVLILLALARGRDLGRPLRQPGHDGGARVGCVRGGPSRDGRRPQQQAAELLGQRPRGALALLRATSMLITRQSGAARGRSSGFGASAPTSTLRVRDAHGLLHRNAGGARADRSRAAPRMLLRSRSLRPYVRAGQASSRPPRARTSLSSSTQASTGIGNLPGSRSRRSSLAGRSSSRRAAWLARVLSPRSRIALALLARRHQRRHDPRRTRNSALANVHTAPCRTAPTSRWHSSRPNERGSSCPVRQAVGCARRGRSSRQGTSPAAARSFRTAHSKSTKHDWRAWLDLAIASDGAARRKALARARALYPNSTEITRPFRDSSACPRDARGDTTGR